MISSGKVAIGCDESRVVVVSRCCSKVMAGEVVVSSVEVVLGWAIMEKACSEGSSLRMVGHV